MRVLVKEGEAVLADLSFEDEEVLIGSEPTCAIHLPDMRVSPHNAVLQPTESGDWNVAVLDPDNTVLLNGHRVVDSMELRNGDEITLHEYLLKVYTEAALERHVVEDVQLSAEELAKIREYPLPAGSVVKRHFDPVSLAHEHLDLVGRIAADLMGCRDIHELVEEVLSTLLVQFKARAAWIGIRRQTRGELEIQAGKLPSGQPCGTNPIIELLQYRCVERNQHVCVRKVRDHEEIGSAMAVPLSAAGGTLGMVYVDRRVRSKRFQIPDLDVLTALASPIAAKLHALVQQRLQRSAEVSTTETSVVHAIQAQLDPKYAPSFKNLQLAAYSRSGQERPGDVYDVMKHPDTEITSFLLGHVNATGALLAMSLARLHATFRVAMLHNDPPHAFSRELNWLMYDERDPSTVDSICVVIDPPSGKLRYSRAGKMGALILNARGEPRPLQDTDTPPVGQVRNYEYVPRNEQLGSGETLVLYSRGVATCSNAAGERFGERRFLELVCDAFGQPPSQTVQDLSYELSTFFADGRHPDDISIVLLHRT